MDQKKIAIIGGCGHVGLPLGIRFAENDFKVTLIDTNQQNVECVNRGCLPFFEDDNALLTLKKAVEKTILKQLPTLIR